MTTVPSNLVPTKITDLPVAPVPTPSATMVCVIGGITYQVPFIDLQSTVSVPASREINTGGGLQGGGDLSADRTLSIATGGVTPEKLADSGVVADTYGSGTMIPVLSIDAKGRIVDATEVALVISGYVPDTRQIIAGAGLTGGGNLQANRTLSVDFATGSPEPLGTAAAGTENAPARGDHVHPALDFSNPTEYTGLLPLTRGGTGQNVTVLTAGAVWFTDGNNGFLQTTQGVPGQVLVSNGPAAPDWGVALIVNDQPANYVYAGPTSGPDGQTTFRFLVDADIPAVLTGKTLSGLNNTFSHIGNSSLTYSQVTFNGVLVSLGSSGTITAVNPFALTMGTGLSGSSYDGAGAVTIALSNTGVTAASYGAANKTLTAAVNAQGQLTSLAETPIDISYTQVSGLGSAALLTAGAAGGVATLDGTGKVPLTQLPPISAGGLTYQGVWDALTNTPALASSVGTNGYFYVVDVAGTTNLNGIIDWQLGDWAIFNGSVWQKVDNSDAVTSVNGQIGTVVLDYADVGAPSTSGTNATGTWSIDINGNASTVTNGLYSNGSYSNPTWLTSLATSKLSGQVAVVNGGTNLASYTVGDLLWASGATTLSKLGIGTNTYILTSSGAAPQWSNPSSVSVGSATNATNATNATDATNAANVAVAANTTNANYHLTFVSSTTGNLPLQVNSSITCNPSTGALTGGICGGAF